MNKFKRKNRVFPLENNHKNTKKRRLQGNSAYLKRNNFVNNCMLKTLKCVPIAVNNNLENLKKIGLRYLFLN